MKKMPSFKTSKQDHGKVPTFIIKASEMLVAPPISECFGIPWSAIVCLGLQYCTFGTFGTFGTYIIMALSTLLVLLALLTLANDRKHDFQNVI